jgi:hypothetical protein
MIGRFSTICGSGRQWAEALDLMDRTNRLSRQEKNELLDTLTRQIDAEHALAARVLRARLAARKRGER